MSLSFFDNLLDWQNRVMRSQICLFNTSILLIVCVIFTLVTFVPSFNYKTNILNFFWFSMAFCFLVLMGLSTLIWSIWVFPSKIFSLKLSIGNKEDNTMKTSVTRKRHITGESNRDSIYSASASIIKGDNGPWGIEMKVIYCFFVMFLALLPTILGIFLFKFIPDTQLFYDSN